ncbi:protein containing Shikimate dehydrogenase substrate binding protein, partial [mine drainage metagenome]
MTTGPSGPLLRALGARLGAAWVYARLPTKAADDPPVEATQLPVDDLLRFFEAGPDAPLFALLGRPVAHSISPRLHGGWMRRAGRAGLYLPLEIGTADELAVVVRRLPALGFRGANVTHPWKEAALGIAVRATASARDAGRELPDVRRRRTVGGQHRRGCG